jgi:hypothetical protein
MWRPWLAFAAALSLDLPVYDTQCGAKVFRVNDGLRRALREPFLARWAFDVELLARLLDDGTTGIVEVPLLKWCDVTGGSLGPRQMVEAGIELGRLARRRRR